MMCDAAFTDLWLAKRDLPRARAHADKFLEAARSTAERTWQALAWEARARVADADHDPARSRECLGRAIASMEGFETPIAAWRVHATAAELMARADSVESVEAAARHHESSRATVQKLADSLPANHPLRATFLTSALRRLDVSLVDHRTTPD